jgi:hypothetical protein
MNCVLTDWQKSVRLFLRQLCGVPGLSTYCVQHLPERVLSFGDARGINAFVLCVGMCGEFAGNTDADVCRDGNSAWADAWGGPDSDARASAYACIDDLAYFIEKNF